MVWTARIAAVSASALVVASLGVDVAAADGVRGGSSPRRSEFDDGGLRGGLSGLSWSDWDGKKVCHPLSFVLPESEAEVVATVQRAARERVRVRVVGAGHSFSAITQDSGAYFLSLDRMRDPICIHQPTGSDAALVTVQAGMRLFELNDFLERHQLALENLGATTEQSVAGAISTGTHGTGAKLGSISTLVRGLRLVTASGELLDVDAASMPDVFAAARISLGALGVITRVTLEVRPLFYLRLETISLPAHRLAAVLPQVLARHERVQWFYFPYESSSKNATLLVRKEVPRPPRGNAASGCWSRSSDFAPRLDEETGGTVVGSCTDVAYKALSDSRQGYRARKLYTEMEMFVPAGLGQAAVDAFVSWATGPAGMSGRDPLATVFLGVRYVSADEIWLSPQNGRDSAVISLIVEGTREATGNTTEFNRLANALERIAVAEFQGVPHWGKENFAKRGDLERVYSKMGDFNRVRSALDPTGLFQNEYIVERLGDVTAARTAARIEIVR